MKGHSFSIPDPWTRLSEYADGPIALGRAGTGLPTQALLGLRLGLAEMSAALERPLDIEALALELAGLGKKLIVANSRARGRAEVLARPLSGGRLDEASRLAISAASSPNGCDVAIVIGDGFSSLAAERYAPSLLAALLPLARRLDIAPVCVAANSCVALGDEIGSLFGARVALVLMGDRPGTVAHDSLGVTLTYAPSLSRTETDRLKILGVRESGLGPERAAGKAMGLIEALLNRPLDASLDSISGCSDRSEREAAAWRA